MSTTLKKSVCGTPASKSPGFMIVRTKAHAASKAKGVVNRQIHRADASISPGQLIEAIDSGLPFGELEELQASLEMPMEHLASKLGMSIATIQRRKLKGHLESGESDRVVRFARLMGKALAVFGNDHDARQWLKSPQFGLGGSTPLDYARTEVGAREVENLLGRIEYGVYS